jgi:hypothetical protein
MRSHPQKDNAAPLDLSKWRNVPNLMIGLGGLLALLGAFSDRTFFGYSWLVGFMFCFCLCVGGLFLVLVHHLFDACWSVPVRRICENIASLMPWMAVFFIPIALLAKQLYPWMTSDPATDHALHAKLPLFTMPGFYGSTIVIFAVLSFLALALRKNSIAQDKDGAARHTFTMRRLAYVGIFCFAFLVTLGVILWMKALQHQFFSTMYGVYYFAGSVWTTLATVYFITMALARMNVLRSVLHQNQFYYLGCLFFAFTVFYAYVTFSQYFIIWNANVPEETFWFVQREHGSWFGWSLIIIFGHFFLPFLALLRIDAKESFKVMTFFAAWAWAMRFVDMVFNIMPIPSPDGVPFVRLWLPLACTAFMAGVLIKVYLARYASAAPYPLKDPRLIEAVAHHHPVVKPQTGGKS